MSALFVKGQSRVLTVEKVTTSLPWSTLNLYHMYTIAVNEKTLSFTIN